MVTILVSQNYSCLVTSKSLTQKAALLESKYPEIFLGGVAD